MKSICWLLLCLLASLVLAVAGCRSLFAPASAYNQIGAQPGGVSPSFTPSGKLQPGQPMILSGKTAVQSVVAKQVWLFWIAGLLCLLAAGALAYFGQYLAAVKVGLAGLILPIFATWWSQHYAVVIAVTLIGAAVWYVLTHAAARGAISAELDKIKSSIEKKTP